MRPTISPFCCHPTTTTNANSSVTLAKRCQRVNISPLYRAISTDVSSNLIDLHVSSFCRNRPLSLSSCLQRGRFYFIHQSTRLTHIYTHTHTHTHTDAHAHARVLRYTTCPCSRVCVCVSVRAAVRSSSPPLRI